MLHSWDSLKLEQSGSSVRKSPPVLPDSFKVWLPCPFGCIASLCSILPPGRPLILSPLGDEIFPSYPFKRGNRAYNLSVFGKVARKGMKLPFRSALFECGVLEEYSALFSTVLFKVLMKCAESIKAGLFGAN